MLVDTDVLIWYMRGQVAAAKFISELESFSISAVTYMELVQGMRNKRELLALRHAVKAWRTPVLAITEAISNRAIAYAETHFMSHSLRLGDALIAATAVEHGLPIATANTKHYQVLSELTLHPFRLGSR